MLDWNGLVLPGAALLLAAAMKLVASSTHDLGRNSSNAPKARSCQLVRGSFSLNHTGFARITCYS